MIILTFDVELNAEIAVFQFFVGFQSCTKKSIVIIIGSYIKTNTTVISTYLLRVVNNE